MTSEPLYFVELQPNIYHVESDSGARIGNLVEATTYATQEIARKAYRAFWEKHEVVWPRAVVRNWDNP